MKYIYIKLLIILFALMTMVGCIGTKKIEPVVTTEIIEFESLETSIAQAYMAAQTAKNGDLKSLPFIKVSSNTKIDIDKMLHNNFKTTAMLISNYKKETDGKATLSFLTEATDIYGRIDRRIEKMAYKSSMPDTAQLKSITAWLMEKSPSFQAKSEVISQEDLKGFQKENNLIPDGQFGPRTAETLAQHFSIIDIDNFRSKIFYPSTPNHMLFLLPYEVFEKEFTQLPKGFKSWLTLGKHGISKEKFKETAKKGDKYILFVYFFDRVDPNFGISVGLSTKPKQRGTISDSEPYHAKPGTWPVIATPFTINDVPAKLYVNIFMEKSSVNKPCIESHKLL